MLPSSPLRVKALDNKDANPPTILSALESCDEEDVAAAVDPKPVDDIFSLK